MSMRVEIVPCLSDNYAYLVIDEGTGAVGVVDASEAGPVIAALERLHLEPTAILSTHHHHDHVGGNEEIAKRWPAVKVYGHRSDEGRVPALTERLDDGARFSLGELDVQAHHVPGHTLGAVTYVIRAKGDEPAWAFTGDTLFLAGCGRLFEGTAAQMHRSLVQVLAKLDPATRVGCGHEYTASNLKFAAHVEPKNGAIAERAAKTAALRAQGKPTVPGTIGDERATNPFVRVDEPDVRAHVGLGPSDDPIEVLARLREEKNNFR